ncbi:MAG TPA: hypothetical protein VFP32_02180 [Candidatus Saccharimonadales bacterium]|nr:hypothetical protein [Candidatus Saccharimonadales bacterium]
MTTSGRGYTIFEVMIVLAVTSVLFVSAVTVFSGRQQKTQFSQMMYDLQSQIQSYANQVSTGAFPGTQNYSCSAQNYGDPSYTRPVLTATPQAQSTSQDCVYLGRAIQAIPGRSQIYTYNVLGLHDAHDDIGTDLGLPAATLAESKPEPATDKDTRTKNYLMDTYNLLPSVKIVSAKYYPTPISSQESDILELYASFQSASSASTQSITAQSVKGSYDYPPAADGSLNSSLRTCLEMTDSPSANCQTPVAVGANGWRLCVKEDGSNRMAELTVIGTATGITTNLNMESCTS